MNNNNDDDKIIPGDYDLCIDGCFYEAFTWYTNSNKPGKFFSVYSGKEI